MRQGKKAFFCKSGFFVVKKLAEPKKWDRRARVLSPFLSSRRARTRRPPRALLAHIATLRRLQAGARGKKGREGEVAARQNVTFLVFAKVELWERPTGSLVRAVQ